MTSLGKILTLPIGGVAWSFGYEWATAGSRHRLLEQALAEAAQTGGADVVVCRDDPSHPQFALGSLAPRDRQRGMAAAIAFASGLAAQTIQSGVGLFELPNGMYWVIAVAEDQIYPDGDRVFDHIDSAGDAFAAALEAQPKWGRIYAPLDIIRAASARIEAAREQGLGTSALDRSLVPNGEGAGQASPAPLTTMLAGKAAPRHRLTKTRAVDVQAYLPPLKPGLAVIAGVGVLMLGYIYGLPLLSPPPPPPRQEVAPPPAPPPPEIRTRAPSIDAPKSSAILAACFDAMANVDDHSPRWGWTATSYSCRQTQLTAAFTRHDGDLATIEAAYPDQRVAFALPNYDVATLSLSLPFPQPVQGDDLDNVEPLRRRLVTFGWETGEKITVPPFMAPQGRSPQDKARWLVSTITIQTQLLPTDWGPELDKYPGLVVTELSADPSKMLSDPRNFEWTIKGDLYANP
jgi:hypothetical protein